MICFDSMGKNETSPLLNTQDLVGTKKCKAKAWAISFGICHFLTSLFYMICDPSLFSVVEVLVVACVIAFMVLIKRHRPTPKHLNGLCIIVFAIGCAAISRAVVFRILASDVHWIIVGDALCGCCILISTTGLLLSMLEFKHAIILECPGYASDSSFFSYL